MSDKREYDDPSTVEVPGMLKHPLKEDDQRDVVGEVSGDRPGVVVEAHGAGHAVAEDPNATGLYFFGVVRARTWRGRERRGQSGIQRVRYRDLEALVKEVPFVMPPSDSSAVDDHQRTVEHMMRRTTILPAPFGIVFKGRRQLIHMMQEQYLVLDEGLALLDGHWELRLHVSASAVGEVEDSLGDVAMTIYSELRRFARAAVPFPNDDRRLVSAAFLVDRTTWVEFIERIEDFGAQHNDLSFDVTGPWPPYDFVRIVV